MARTVLFGFASMTQLSPRVTGRKSGQTGIPSNLPLLVDVREARRMLGDMSKNKFWEEARLGKFELVGSDRKRFVVVASLKRYVDRLPRRQSTLEANTTA
jgi:hypothetical protein